MAQWNRVFHIGAGGIPACTRHFIGIAKIAIRHHIVDACSLVAVIIIVALPHGAIAVYRHFIRVPEIIAQALHV